jgi:hypothetical protein
MAQKQSNDHLCRVGNWYVADRGMNQILLRQSSKRMAQDIRKKALVLQTGEEKARTIPRLSSHPHALAPLASIRLSTASVRRRS